MDPFRLSDNFIRLASFHARGLPIDLANVKKTRSFTKSARRDGWHQSLQTTRTLCILSSIREAGYSAVKAINLNRLGNVLPIHPVDL